MKFYLVYINRNNKLAAAGTAEQCARTLGMTRQSFYNIISRAKRGALEKYCIVEAKDEEMR